MDKQCRRRPEGCTTRHSLIRSVEANNLTHSCLLYLHFYRHTGPSSSFLLVVSQIRKWAPVFARAKEVTLKCKWLIEMLIGVTKARSFVP